MRRSPQRERIADLERQVARQGELLKEMREALAAIDALYVSAWDCTDGSLHFMEWDVPKFEAAHEKIEAMLELTEEWGTK